MEIIARLLPINMIILRHIARTRLNREEDVYLLTIVDPVMWNTVPVASDRISNQHHKVKDEKKVSKQQQQNILTL